MDVEAHINARHLIARYGSPDQKHVPPHRPARGICLRSGSLDPPGDNLRTTRTPDGFPTRWRQMFCSAAGFATRAPVTAVDDAGHSRMMVIALGNGECVTAAGSAIAGHARRGHRSRRFLRLHHRP